MTMYPGKTVYERITNGLAAGDPDAVIAKGLYDRFRNRINQKGGVDEFLIQQMGAASGKFTR